jgi:hypothetical protein
MQACQVDMHTAVVVHDVTGWTGAQAASSKQPSGTVATAEQVRQLLEFGAQTTQLTHSSKGQR